MTAKKLNPIRTAVIGLGRAGWNIHAKTIRGRQDFVLTDVADLAEDRLEEAKAIFGCGTFRDYRQMLRESDAELFIVASQSVDHAPMCIDALKTGKVVLSEKPMAVTLRETDKVLAAAKRSKGLFTVHQNARLQPDFLHIKEVLRSRVLGDIFMIKRGAYGFGRRNDWQVLRKYGGGQLFNHGVHLLDQVLQLLDSPVKDVFGDLKRVQNPGDAEDHLKVVLRAESGMVADVEATTVAAITPFTWVLMGTKGTLVSDGKVSRLRYYTQKLPRIRPVDAPRMPTRTYGVIGGETIVFKEEERPSTLPPKKTFYDYLYDTIRKGKPLFVTPESVRVTMSVIDRARKGTPFG